MQVVNSSQNANCSISMDFKGTKIIMLSVLRLLNYGKLHLFKFKEYFVSRKGYF